MGSRSDSYRLHEPAKCDRAKTGEACYLLQARTARRRTESEIVDNPCIAGAAPKRRDLSLQEAHAEDQRGGQMISRPVAIKRCSFRSEVAILCLQAAIAARVGLRGETSERHRQTQRYQSSSFVLRGSYGLSATSGLRGPTLCTPTIKPIDVMPHEIIGHQRLLSERSTDAPPPA
jgi:hypothetical protein